MLDHRHTLASQQRLIDAQSGRVDCRDTNISRHFVTHSHFDNVARDKFSRFDALDLPWFVLSHDFGDFGLVFFECLDSALSISFLDERSGARVKMCAYERVEH